MLLLLFQIKKKNKKKSVKGIFKIITLDIENDLLTVMKEYRIGEKGLFTSPTWGPPPPCKQTLKVRNTVKVNKQMAARDTHNKQPTHKEREDFHFLK